MELVTGRPAGRDHRCWWVVLRRQLHTAARSNHARASAPLTVAASMVAAEKPFSAKLTPFARAAPAVIADAVPSAGLLAGAVSRPIHGLECDPVDRLQDSVSRRAGVGVGGVEHGPDGQQRAAEQRQCGDGPVRRAGTGGIRSSHVGERREGRTGHGGSPLRWG
jgi:hypothetical protein